MRAPQRFVQWLQRPKPDKFGNSYSYHPRSNKHSIALANSVWEDLLESCRAIRDGYKLGLVGFGVNYKYLWAGTRKVKELDLAVGAANATGGISEVLLSCEFKAAMTEHVKAQPRAFDELSSSHQIVHASNTLAIAAGLTVVNIADSFVSPLRNQRRGGTRVATRHVQPKVAANMVEHLRGLAVSYNPGQVGFDAYCTFVVDCDNEGHAALWEQPPAPQLGDPDHYEEFLRRLSHVYSERYG